ncbi:OmpP1/FadL family transporter [Desulfobulbus sp.]|uniref:OmpP1/FadL family transporter n=1 Tax=Desulfobulbus sp. TaxID=895 RepID=UPI00286EC642|nr:OmpP1/FadL family transporter [Desulfobulbus sp.]
MRKTCGIAGLILLAADGSALASGYRIPEQSVNSVARAGGYVAYTPGADASYYNPANMSWLENRAQLEADATWIHLSSIDYEDRNPARSGDAEAEDFFMPTFFAVSPEYNKFRFGFSVTAPGGLSKQWQEPYPRTYAEEFSLKIFEFNPTVSYKFCDRFSVGAGIRGVYTDGKVKGNANDLLTRDLKGDSWDAGYNLAATLRPVDNMNLSVTYRSKVDLSVEGDATLRYVPMSMAYSGSASVEIPLPAVLAVAASYTFFDQLTVELAYDRTYWSDYEYLDFNYSSVFRAPSPFYAFDSPIAKKWEDTDSWRLSVTYDLKNNWILMAGFAIDENPVSSNTLGFELPDSDARLYSVGARYKINDNMEIGAAYLYDDKESRRVSNATVNGEFTDAAAHLLTFGFTYKL